MRKIFIILALFLFSCSQQTHDIEIIPDETAAEKQKPIRPSYKEKENDINKVEESKFFEENIDISDIEIDSTAQISIISQIPFECFNLYDSADLVELKTKQNSPKSLLLEVPQDFFFNSIQTANEISEFAKTNPASVRGIFGDLMGINELAKGTQKVLFGIKPRDTKIMEFRFETADFGIINQLVWNFNKKFDISLSENKISMNGKNKIILENIKTFDPLKMLGENNELSAFLFKKNDLKLVKSDLQDFNGSIFDNFTVSAFFNPLIDGDTKNALSNLMKSANFSKKLDYNLNVFTDEKIQNSGNIEKDSIVIIYENNNLIAFETAMVLSQSMQEKTDKKIIATADFEQRKLFNSDYDIAISANSKSLNEQFLSRKISDSKIDLFEMKIYLVSMQKIITQSNIISNLEVVK